MAACCQIQYVIFLILKYLFTDMLISEVNQERKSGRVDFRGIILVFKDIIIISNMLYFKKFYV